MWLSVLLVVLGISSNAIVCLEEFNSIVLVSVYDFAEDEETDEVEIGRKQRRRSRSTIRAPVKSVSIQMMQSCLDFV